MPNDKLSQIPSEIIERLNLDRLKNDSGQPARCFLAGPGWENFLPAFQAALTGARIKIFVATPDKPAGSALKKTDDLVILTGNFQEKLASFPPATFDLIVLLWNLPAIKPINTLKQIHQSLKNNGQFALVTPWESSPAGPLNILRKACARLKLRMYKSDLPKDKRRLRKMMEEIRFHDVRIWLDTIRSTFPSAGYVFDNITEMSPGGLFREEVPDEIKLAIRAKFIELFEANQPETEKDITVYYEFGGAVGIK